MATAPTGSRVSGRAKRRAPKVAIISASAGRQADSDLLGSLYDTVGNPAAWQQFLSQLTADSSFNRAALAMHDTAMRTGDIGLQNNIDDSDVERYGRYYAGINPLIDRPEARPVGVVLTGEQVVSHADLLRSEFYQDFWRPLDIDCVVGGTVVATQERSLVISLLGLRANLEREENLLRRLQMLMPHMLRAAQLNRQLASVQSRAEAAEDGLERLATAVFIINATGRVCYVNRAGERIIAADDGVSLLHEKLEAARPQEGQALRQLVHQALLATRHIAASPGGVLRISRKSGRAAYEVLVAPISDRMVKLDFSFPMVAVFVRDPASTATAPQRWLQDLYALTHAEARLMQALLAGRSLEDITDIFKVSKETVRSQLKSVFLKTGTKSQLELLRLGLRGLAILRDRSSE